MTSQDIGGVGLPEGRAAAWACRRGPARSLWWLPASSGCTARRWGATGRGLGVLRVGGAFVQYAQPVVSRSRPSWSRPTQADSGQSRRRTMTTGPQRRRRSEDGGGGPVAEMPGPAVRSPDSLLRGPVSTALTSTSLPSKHPAQIVGILRFLPDAQRRCACDVSTMDTHTPSCLALRPPSPSGPPACPRLPPSECLRSHDAHMTQKPGDNTADKHCVRHRADSHTDRRRTVMTP